MEPVFVCEFTPTVPMVAARIRKYSEARCALLLIMGIGLFGYVLFHAIMTLIYLDFPAIWIWPILFSLALLLYGIFFPQINAYFAVRNYKKDTSGNGTYKISFGEKIEVTQGTLRSIWEYSDIQNVYHLKYSYELAKSKRLALCLDPDGFTKGNFAEFKQFLKEKRPDLSIPE